MPSWLSDLFAAASRLLTEYSGGVGDSLHYIILLPFLGAVVNGLLGKRLGRTNVNLIASGSVFGAFVISALALWRVTGGGDGRLDQLWWHWFAAGPINVDLSLAVDPLSGTLICVVTGVGFLIHVFSTEYMGHDEGFWRFFAYLNFFVAMMATLVLGSNLVVMFVGWEGVGLASYLLIGFWYTDDVKAFAGRKAFIVNRIGDFGFILGIFTLIALFGTVDFAELSAASLTVDPTRMLAGGLFAGHPVGFVITAACLLLFVGACGKSAQFPLYVWLPDAMAGPTPVSALIHAATMVTAGVYMVARMSFLYALSPTAMGVVASIGLFTAVFAALIAFTQNDIKKVLAYSTVSQLGFMFIGVGVGAWWAAIYHLVTHAFFKALMFLGAGAVMHGMKDETDIRKFGGLRREMWHTWVTFLVGTIAITGVLPLSGFFSKDAILHAAHVNPNPWFAWLPTLVYVGGLAAAAGTAFYMWRMHFLTFMGERRGLKDHHAHDSGFAISMPLWVLSGLAVGAAAWGFPTHEGSRFERLLAPVFRPATQNFARTLTRGASELGITAPQVPGSHDFWGMAPGYATAMAIGLIGMAIAWALYLGPGKRVPAAIAARMPAVYTFWINKFYVDELYHYAFVAPLKGLAQVLWKVMDSLAIDRILVNGTAQATAWFAQLIRFFQNGDAQRYAAVMAASALVLLWIFLD